MIKKDFRYNKKEVLEKAQELERRANNLGKLYNDFEGDEFSKTKAELYETAGEHYLNAKKPRKAASCYENASKSWEHLQDTKIGADELGMRSGVKLGKKSSEREIATQYGKNAKKDLRNADRIRKTIKGNFKGLEGKSVAGIIGILGLLGSAFLFSGKITGNAIGDLSSQTTNVFGGILFIVGIVGCLFYFKNRK